MKRKGKISRKTKETSISVDINIDGKGKYKIDTGIGFLNIYCFWSISISKTFRLTS